MLNHILTNHCTVIATFAIHHAKLVCYEKGDTYTGNVVAGWEAGLGTGNYL